MAAACARGRLLSGPVGGCVRARCRSCLGPPEPRQWGGLHGTLCRASGKSKSAAAPAPSAVQGLGLARLPVPCKGEGLHGSQFRAMGGFEAAARDAQLMGWILKRSRRSKMPEPEPQADSPRADSPAADSPAADSPEPGPLKAGPPPRPPEHRPLSQWGNYSFGEGRGGSQRHNGERKGARAGDDPASGSARAALDGGERKGDSGEDSGDGYSPMGDGGHDEEEPLLPQWSRRVAPRFVSARTVEDQNREANWSKGCFASLYSVLAAVMVVAAGVVGAGGSVAAMPCGSSAASIAASFKCGVCLSESLYTQSISCEECNVMMCASCDLSGHPNLHTHTRWLHSGTGGRRGLDAEEFAIQG
ncbi:hypothetical protein T492DRAFT_849966 [Pavlovales sp. CCMP2436]|nr:hypothetical protein T492DRAFT_849966 [Pavlovales sp. CCMP2436]